MFGSGRRAGTGTHPRRRVIALAVLAKLALLAGLLALPFAADHLGAGAWLIAAHGVILAVILTVAAWAVARQGGLVGGTGHGAGGKAGIVLHGAASYDLLARILTFGREGRLRAAMLRLARLRPAEAVLDVGCGTGTLALAAKRQVGPDGSVTGIDASPEMIERARAKAKAARLALTFVNGAAQQLPFADAAFDVVMGTLMLHHLPKPARAAFAREARRVLKPGGRLLLIDFGKPARPAGLARLHRHGHIDMNEVGAMLTEFGLTIGESGALGTMNLNYVCAVTQEDRPVEDRTRI